MIIDFSKIQEDVMPEFKGGTGEYIKRSFSQDGNMVMHGTLKTGCSIGFHKHIGNCEMIYVISGKGTVKFNDTEEFITAGQVHYCPENNSHSLTNNEKEDLVFFAVVPKQ